MRLITALLLTAVLTGCASAPDPAPSSTPPPPSARSGSAASSASPATSTPPGPSTPSGPSVSAVPTEPVSRQALPLQVGFAQPDPRSIVVQVVTPATCPPEQVRYALTETAQRVSVRITVAATAPGACRGAPTAHNVVLALAQPLSDRELVDAGSGTAVQVATGDPPGPPVPTVSAAPQ